jgi:hypothetical protein
MAVSHRQPEGEREEKSTLFFLFFLLFPQQLLKLENRKMFFFLVATDANIKRELFHSHQAANNKNFQYIILNAFLSKWMLAQLESD